MSRIIGEFVGMLIVMFWIQHQHGAEIKEYKKQVTELQQQLKDSQDAAANEKYKRELCVSTFGASENGNHQNQSSSAKHKAHSLGDPG